MATAKKATAKKAPAKKTTVVKSAPAKKATAKKAGRYAFDVEMNGQSQSGSTDTIARTIEALRPDRLNTNVVLRFSIASVKDAKVFTDVLNIPRARRLFYNTTAADLFEKRVKMGLGDFNV